MKRKKPVIISDVLAVFAADSQHSEGEGRLDPTKDSLGCRLIDLKQVAALPPRVVLVYGACTQQRPL